MVRRVTFSPSVALDYETIDFLAFGHELVDALVERVSGRGYPGRTSHRTIKTDEQLPRVGWAFTFVLELDGVIRAKEVFPIFIDSDGTEHADLAAWLLDRSLRLKRESWPEAQLPSRGPEFDAAVEKAKTSALRRLLERQTELAVINKERLAQERAKVERFYEYKETAAQEKLESVRRTFDRLSTSEDPDVQKILPVWAKNLENAKRVLESLGVERDRRLGDLTGRAEVTAQHEMLTASYIEIVSEPPDHV